MKVWTVRFLEIFKVGKTLRCVVDVGPLGPFLWQEGCGEVWNSYDGLHQDRDWLVAAWEVDPNPLPRLRRRTEREADPLRRPLGRLESVFREKRTRLV